MCQKGPINLVKPSDAPILSMLVKMSPGRVKRKRNLAKTGPRKLNPYYTITFKVEKRTVLRLQRYSVDRHHGALENLAAKLPLS